MLAQEFQHGSVPGVDLQFVVDVLEVGAHGVQADVHLIPDFLVEAAVSQMC